MRGRPFTLFAIGVALGAIVLGLGAIGGHDAVLFVAPLLTLAASLVAGVYPGEDTLARLRRRRLRTGRLRPARVLHALVATVAPPAGAYRRALPRRGPPLRAIAA